MEQTGLALDERQETALGPDILSELAIRIRDLGLAIGLPYVAATADISSPEPMLDAGGRPFAESLFRWIDPRLEYWKDRGFALRAPFITAVRFTCEPFFFQAGAFASWRPTPRLDVIEVKDAAESFGVGSAIIAPVYLPDGVLGAVVWASPEDRADVPQVFAERAAELHSAAIRFVAAYHDGLRVATEPARLTRREVQCLKWAAAGKTDQEVAQIIHIAMPTVRFHIRNAAGKLRVAGRSQAIHRAATLGYIGAVRPPPTARVG
jgi:DNA-binding CsgD family transcriptional regulator